MLKLPYLYLLIHCKKKVIYFNLNFINHLVLS